MPRSFWGCWGQDKAGFSGRSPEIQQLLCKEGTWQAQRPLRGETSRPGSAPAPGLAQTLKVKTSTCWPTSEHVLWEG